MFLLIIPAYLLVGYLEIMPLIKKRQKREILLYSILMATALTFSLLISFNVDLPSPTASLEKLIRTFLNK